MVVNLSHQDLLKICIDWRLVLEAVKIFVPCAIIETKEKSSSFIVELLLWELVRLFCEHIFK